MTSYKVGYFVGSLLISSARLSGAPTRAKVQVMMMAHEPRGLSLGGFVYLLVSVGALL